MKGLIKGLVGLSFAAYCGVSTVWIAKNMKLLSDLTKDEPEEKPKKEPRRDRTKKWIILPARDDD